MGSPKVSLPTLMTLAWIISTFVFWEKPLLQVILFEIDCAIFYTNLHELFCQFISWTNWVNSGKLLNTITYKSRLTQKKLYKETDAIFSIYGKNGIIPWHFFWILSWAFRGCWGRMKIEVKFLRLRPRNFAIIPDTFSPHLKMVR